mmetsp:Transcript_50088/g.100547  ORF Transcript_50088/g.100547 Transcript_50088/m.100547 type:complete len:380 (-) Transcript_50088:8-1147(-)
MVHLRTRVLGIFGVGFTAFLVSLQTVFAQTGLPYISGSWELTFIFNEIRGDVGKINPCRGSFPYQYKYEVDILQGEGDTNIRWCYRGDVCEDQSVTGTLEEATIDVSQARCSFKPHDLPPPESNPDPFDESPLCQGQRCVSESRVHQYDLLPNCNFDTPCPEGTSDPQQSRLFSMFQLPTKPPYVWAMLCRLYDFAEAADGPPDYAGTWRHMNETWAFVLDASTCDCYTGNCSVCEVTPPGTNLLMADEQCFEEGGFSLDGCQYKLVGVTGGPVVYPLRTTGVPYVGDPQEPQVCFQYATIEGKMVKPHDQMIKNHPEWANLLSNTPGRRQTKTKTEKSDVEEQASAWDLGGVGVWEMLTVILVGLGIMFIQFSPGMMQ